MNNQNPILSRRKFIALGLKGTLSASAFPLLANTQNSTLAFRDQAPILPLHFNENPLGMSGLAQAAAKKAVTEMGNRYADEAIVVLKQDLARLNGVTEEQIILGNGSTEVLEGIVARAARTNAKIIEPVPTYGDVRRYAKNFGLEVISVPVDKGFVTDIAALRDVASKQTGPVLVNLCNPNNPTGTIVDSQALIEWLNEAPESTTFVVDEAYHDYAQLNPGYQSMLPVIKSGRENLFVARTFSKIYGMAGMRVGYGIAAPETAKETRPFATDYNLNVAGVAAAIASLKDRRFYEASQQSNVRAKAVLLETLDNLGLNHIQSNTNFVLHQIRSNVADYQRRMLANHIKVGRRMTPQDGWNRITIGTEEQMQVFSKTLQGFRQKGWV